MARSSGPATSSPCRCRPFTSSLWWGGRNARAIGFPAFPAWFGGPMLDQSVIDALRAIAGEARVLTSQVSLTYSYDATADVPRRIPNVVVMPVESGGALIFNDPKSPLAQTLIAGQDCAL